MTRLYTDEKVRAIAPAAAVAAIKEAVLASYRGQTLSPPRVRAELGDSDYVFTASGAAGPYSGCGPTGPATEPAPSST